MKRGLWVVVMLSLLLIVRCSNDNNNDTGTAPVGNPSIVAITPSEVGRGATHVEGSLFGTNLNSVTDVSLGGGITVEQVRVVSASEVDIVFSVNSNAAAGERPVNVTTSTGGNFSATVTLKIINNHAPIAKFKVDPPEGSVSVTFTFDATASSDPDGDNFGVRWDFGDGTIIQGDRTVKHRFSSVGQYSVELKVTDSKGSQSSARRKFDIAENSPPIPKFSVDPPDGNLGTEFFFDASASYDPDGKVASYKWDFGDGNDAQGKTAKHAYKKEGEYDVTLTVKDNKGQDATSKADKVHVDKTRETACGGSGHSHPTIIKGRVVSVEPGNWAIVNFGAGASCATIWHRCDDFRRLRPEGFYGIVDKMVDRGNGILAVHNSCPYRWPPSANEEVFIYYKTCTQNHCP